MKRNDLVGWLGNLASAGLDAIRGALSHAGDPLAMLRALDVYPTPDSLSDAARVRIRDSVLAAYAASMDPAPECPTVAAVRGMHGGPLRLIRSVVLRMSLPRRALLTLVTAAVLFAGVTGGALAESGPGHSLYRVRITLETLTLPARSSEDRLPAQLHRLELRVTEATAAASEANLHGVDDALAEYRETLWEVMELSGRSPRARLEVITGLRSDILLLDAMADRLAGTLKDRIRAALADTCGAREKARAAAHQVDGSHPRAGSRLCQ